MWLTGAGVRFVEDARAILAALHGAAKRAKAQQQSRPLVIAIRPSSGSGLLRETLRRIDALPVALPVSVQLHHSPVEAVHQNVADVAVTCLSMDTTGLRVEEVAEYPCVVLLSAEHELAQRSSVTLAEVQALSGYLSDYDDVSLDELVEQVRLQSASGLIAEDLADQIGADVCAVPVPDAPPIRIALAYPRSTVHPRLAELITHARRAADTGGDPSASIQ